MNKKGIELPPTVLVMLIIVLVVGIMLIVFTPRLFGGDYGEVSACRASVLTASLGQKLGVNVPRACEGKDIVFEDESPEEVNKIISNELEKCVFKFHAGQIDFSESSSFFVNVFGEDFFNKVGCFRCATIGFKEGSKAYKEYKDELVKHPNTLTDFQNENKVRLALPRVTFREYFGKIRKELSSGEGYMFINDVNRIEPDEEYELFANIYQKGKGSVLVKIAAGISQTLLSAADEVVTLGFLEEVGAIDYYKKAAEDEDMPIPMTIALVPADSNALKECARGFYHR